MLRLVTWGYIAGDSDNDVGGYIEDINDGIVLSIGYVPGLKVEAISLLQTVKVTNLALNHEC